MFSHVMIGSNDLARSKTFYYALFEALGGKPGRTRPQGRLVSVRNGASLMLSAPIDGTPASHPNGGTVGFAMDGPEQVDAWHKAGLAAGGTAIEDPPGPREGSSGPLYLAYLRDPDGNKLCALHRLPA